MVFNGCIQQEIKHINANNDSQMVKYLQGTQTEETTHSLFLAGEPVAEILFETEQIRANKNSCCVDSSLLCKVL